MARRLSTLPAVTLAALLAACDSPAASSAAIFMYHHVDDSTPVSTSVSPETFQEQLERLEQGGYRVLPLIDLLEALAGGESVPDRSVAITFDDGYRSVLTEALPLLEARAWPFTVFVNTEAIDSGYGGYLGWDELRELGRRGATIGNHSVSHAHLVRRNPGETEGAWRARIGHEISAAQQQLTAELGEIVIPVFAYPYGEYDAATRRLVADAGLYGLGQHSGAVGSASDFLALPRYPVATGLAIDDFLLRARSRPLPLSTVGPERHLLDADDVLPELRFAIEAGDDIRLDALACYVSGQGLMDLEWRDEAMREFIVRPLAPVGAGRTKVNCTAPSRQDGQVYYWYGYLWIRRNDDGSWYDE